MNTHKTFNYMHLLRETTIPGDDEQCLNTQKKFNYMHLLRETAIPSDDEHDEETDADETGSETISTVNARVDKLSELVAGLPCLFCRSTTLACCACCKLCSRLGESDADVLHIV